MREAKRYRAREGNLLNVAGIRVTDDPRGVELPRSDLVDDHVRRGRLVVVTGVVRPNAKPSAKSTSTKDAGPAKPHKESPS